jgi:hypothetical protein
MYMLSGCELIDTEHISLPSQNMKFVGEWEKSFTISYTIWWLEPKMAYSNTITYIYNTCALSKHIGNICMKLRNGGKGEASRFAANTHIYLYAWDSETSSQ